MSSMIGGPGDGERTVSYGPVISSSSGPLGSSDGLTLAAGGSSDMRGGPDRVSQIATNSAVEVGPDSIPI